MRSNVLTFISGLALISIPYTCALTLELSNTDSIRKAAQTVAQDLLGYYEGLKPGGTLGLFEEDDDDVYWWESGAALGSLINYWNYTGDSQYNSLVQQALLAQVGPNNDFMPPNQTKTEGNDDQGIWGLAAMTAAELEFPTASASQNITWLSLAKSVFDLQVARWDTKYCSGGLRWQILTFNNGYNYKNAQSTGTFFQLAARLAKFTGNSTYADWAQKSYDWLSSSTLITSDFKVYDGFIIPECDHPSKLQWSYNAANLVYGSAIMYNLTNGNSQWQNRTQSFLSAMSIFSYSSNNVLQEIACEPQRTCNYDQFTFKGIAAQWLGATSQIAPFTMDTIMPVLQASAKGAAATCSGGDNKTACGFHWTGNRDDDETGFGQELSALNVILANLAGKPSAPVTAAVISQNASSTESGSRKPTSSQAPSGTPSASSTSFSSRMLPFRTALLALLFAVAVAFIMM